MKKRSCRRTPEEIRQHEQAVKIRKMTDEQLVNHINSRPCISEASRLNIRKDAVCDFLSSLKPGSGVGPATIAKIKKIAQEAGYLGL